MQPEMTIETTTATIGADASEDDKAMKQYMDLSEENRKKVNELVRKLIKAQED